MSKKIKDLLEKLRYSPTNVVSNLNENNLRRIALMMGSAEKEMRDLGFQMAFSLPVGEFKKLLNIYCNEPITTGGNPNIQ